MIQWFLECVFAVVGIVLMLSISLLFISLAIDTLKGNR
jgi:hypothetical protein